MRIGDIQTDGLTNRLTNERTHEYFSLMQVFKLIFSSPSVRNFSSFNNTAKLNVLIVVSRVLSTSNYGDKDSRILKYFCIIFLFL